MHGISVHGETGERELMILQNTLDALLLLLRCKHLGRIEEWLSRIRPDRKFDRIEANLRAVCCDVFEFAASKKCGHYAKLHRNLRFV